MHKVKFIPSGKSVDIKPGETIYNAAVRAGMVFYDGCDGKKCCGSCRVKVLHGQNTVNKPSEQEKTTIEKYHFQKDERVACLTYPKGDIQITTSYW